MAGLKEIPWFNRPWSKIKEKGVETLDDAELIASIFMIGSQDKNALELANSLLNFVNLNLFSNCSLKELELILNDELKAIQVKSLGELFRRYSKLKKGGYSKKINSSKDVYNLLYDELSSLHQEHFIVIYLDVQNKIISKEIVSKGILNATLVHPREIFISAIKNAANSIVLVHNHPSGELTPSNNDNRITRQLVDVGKIIGIEVIDHVIISSEGYKSIMNC